MVHASEQRPPRRWMITLVVLGLATYGYFQSPRGWNESSRFDLTRSIVEKETFRIDSYHRNTEDKATISGHYYSDKAPGLSFLAVPSYALYWKLISDHPTRSRRLGSDKEEGLAVITFLTVGLISALGLAAFFRIAWRLGGDREAALLATLAWGFGSIAFPNATMFFGHQVCGTLLVVTFALVLDDRLDQNWRPRRMALAGLVGGFAVVTEYPSVVALALIFVYACACSRSARVAIWFCIGGLIPVAILVGYLTACFGAPWHTGYDYVSARFAGMKDGFLGITYPRPGVILSLLVGSWRGLLLMCPILALGGFGLWRLARDGKRGEALLFSAIVGFFLLLNSSYYMWWGGGAFGPRHMVPGLGFLALGLVALRSRRIRTIAWIVLAYSIITMLVATAVDPEPPTNADPILVYCWSQFLDGNLGIRSTNLGMYLGLDGASSLVPLLVVWAGAAGVLVRSRRATPSCSAAR